MRKPGDDLAVNASVSYGNYDAKTAQGAINVALGDNGAMRLSGNYVDRNGYLSDGTRDDKGYGLRFQMLANRVIPSHAFVHIVDIARPVNVAGMRVRDGDLIHADQHGARLLPQRRRGHAAR